MNSNITDKAILKDLISRQKSEMTGYRIYMWLSAHGKNPQHRVTLKRMAQEEERHYYLLADYTGVYPEANPFRVLFYIGVCRLFGLTFGIKLQENEEGDSVAAYNRYKDTYPGIAGIAIQEEEHEEELKSMIKGKNLSFISAVVLGMNDALVELTGALAGFTLALQDTGQIALMGGITGIAAAMSMAASEYLSVKAEQGTHVAVKAAVYTGVSYIITVILLVLPFFILSGALTALAVTITVAVSTIAVFNFYYSVVKGDKFKKRFVEMLFISFAVIIVSFAISCLLRIITRTD